MARCFGTRLKTQCKKHNEIGRASLTAVGEHLKDKGHSLDLLTSTVVMREVNIRRRIGEAIEILLGLNPGPLIGTADKNFQRFIGTFCHLTLTTSSHFTKLQMALLDKFAWGNRKLVLYKILFSEIISVTGSGNHIFIKFYCSGSERHLFSLGKRIFTPENLVGTVLTKKHR